ncbi:hypothetical protein SAMN02746065_12153 [Desulfocicer vacuolatum DSM 3385]|uniref:DUF2066 domain-containing protein n=1 Tax=Desulfocicer vacuolatum DSM 3385 TaxID=1121400 RepID=A0A1W2DWS0_9BACT|nr:hypothetical protein [Desulfocicer vacuolatum]SMD01950.1 hypothetical protein SAMN02746065_12153 [Desulfocicer vacuolatum DSM 3385]
MNRFKPAAMAATGLFFLLTCFCHTAALARENPTVISLGKHAISGDNISKAKKRAIADAMDAAVSQAILAMIPPPEISSSLPLLANVLTGSAQDHIVTYKVLGEIKKGKQYIVAVESTLNGATLNALFSRYQTEKTGKNLPRILIFMSEQVPGEILPRYWWGNNPLPFQSLAQDAFKKVLAGKNYMSMAQPPSEQVRSLGITFNFIHDADAALGMAAQLNADVMIMAKAMAREASNVMGEEKAYKSTVALEAFQVSSGKRLTSFTTDAVVKSDFSQTGIEDSLTQSGTLAAETLLSRLDAAWSGKALGPQTIETRIEGDDYLSSFIMLRKILNTMSGIKDIQTKELSSDNAVVDIIYQGNGRKLADALMVQTFDSFNLSLSNVTDRSLTIRFIPQDGAQPVETKDIEGAFISE